MMETAREAFERGRHEANQVDAWHGVMDALPEGVATDLAVVLRVAELLADAGVRDRLEDRREFTEEKLWEAMIIFNAPSPHLIEARIRRLRELQEAVEAKELAQ